MTRPILEQRIAPQSGTAFEVARGDIVRVTDPLGEQVGDLVAFDREDVREWMSSGRTFDYNSTLLLTTGHVLYSNRSRPLFTILTDTVGRHDFLLAPCSQEMFEILYGYEGDHPSCFANLAGALEMAGVAPDQIPTAFNLFMNVRFSPDGVLSVEPPLSRAGDYIELRAERDLWVGLTACSAELTNNGTFGPIDVRVSRA